MKRRSIILICVICCCSRILLGQQLYEFPKGIFFKLSLDHNVHFYSELVYEEGPYIFTNIHKERILNERNLLASLGWYDVENKYSIAVGSGMNVANRHRAFSNPLFFEGRYYFVKNENTTFLTSTVSQLLNFTDLGGVSYGYPNSLALFRVHPVQRGIHAAFGFGYKYKFFRYLAVESSLVLDFKGYSFNRQSYFSSEQRLSNLGLSLNVALFVFE